MSGVLHCAETVKGGIATYLRDLLPHQREHFGAGQVRVLVPASQLSELSCPEGVVLIPYDDSVSRVSNSLSLARAVLKCVREYQPKVIHVHSTFAGATVRPLLAVVYRDIKLIYCPHGWAWDRPMSSVAKSLTRLVERAFSVVSDSVVCISRYEFEAAVSAGIAKRRLCLVPNGVRADMPIPEGDSPFPDTDLIKLLFVGRFDRQKGVDVYCSALATLDGLAVGSAAGGSVLGDAEEYEFPSNVNRLGWVSSARLQSLLHNADALVVPSRWEGFGLVAVEAMRAGVAVIASRVGGLQEIVDHGTTGFLVEPDDPKAIADIVRSVDRETLKRMGVAGRQRFLEHYTMARVHQQLLEVYEDKSGVQVA